MATHIFHGGDGAISQVANAWAYDPDAPVRLKDDGDPGTAWHANDSSRILNPLGTIKEHGTLIANRWSAMDAGRHASNVIAGLLTGVRDYSDAFISYAKDVYHEAGQMVHNGVRVAVNAILEQLSPETAQLVRNAEEVLSGMNLGHFGNAAAEQAAQVLEMLKDPSTYTGIAISIGATAVQGVPIVGQAVGGAVVVDRVATGVQAGADAVAEIQDITSIWTSEMTPEQLEEARERLAAWMTGSGAALIAALAGKRLNIARNNRSTNRHDGNDTAHSNTKNSGDAKTGCACATGTPVVLATGEKLLDETDFTLPGPIPLVWRRRYRSGSTEESPWGRGWSHPYATELRLGADGLIYLDEQGRHVPLPHVETGAEHFDTVEKLMLRRPKPDVWLVEFKDGTGHLFARREAGQWRLPISAIADRNGHAIRLAWKTAADPFAPPRLESLTDSTGRELVLVWSKSGRLLSVALAGYRSHTLAAYAYDEAGQLVATELAGAPWRRYAWRGGVLVGYLKASGHRFFADYDVEAPHGRVLRSWSPDGPEEHRFDYDLRHRSTRLTDALGRTTTYRYDRRFDIVATVRPDGSRIETPFDTRGNPTGSIDPLGRRTTWRYDARGNIVHIADPAGAATALAYNALDLPVSLTDALGHVWRRDYDARGNLAASTDPLGRTTGYRYDEAGRLIEITDPRGGIKRLEWDEAHNLSAYTDCSGQTTRFAYDALGRLITRTDALDNATTYHWTGLGRLAEVVEPGGATHRYDWDGEGNLLSYTDPLGATTAYTYDGAGRPLTRRDAAGRTLLYAYDAAGRLVCLTNENGAHTHFRYDLADNLTDEIGFDGRHQRYCYNAAGELTHLVEAGSSEFGPGKLTRFERDAIGRLLHKRAEADPPAPAASSTTSSAASPPPTTPPRSSPSPTTRPASCCARPRPSPAPRRASSTMLTTPWATASAPGCPAHAPSTGSSTARGTCINSTWKRPAPTTRSATSSATRCTARSPAPRGAWRAASTTTRWAG